MNGEAYAIAQMIYPMLLTATIVAGALGIVVNRDGSRRVGMVMIGCQLALLGLATIAGWLGMEATAKGHLVSMVIANGMAVIPLIKRPPAPYRIQRIAAGMFMGSALMNAMFLPLQTLPSLVALSWFASAAIDALMVIMLGGFCGGLVGRSVRDFVHRHASGQAHSGHSK